MLNFILNLIKKFIPKKLFAKLQPVYHWSLAKLAALFYGYPSNKMIVIGVTGTAGKSSTCYFIAQLLEAAGFKVGMATTTLFKIADKEWLNDKKMTMLGRFQAQHLLHSMLRNKCNATIIETSSQGIQQFRHIGINYDILVFTNLYPEHIEAHGGFENYKHAKGVLFNYLGKCKKKKLNQIFNKKEIRKQKSEIRDFIKKTIIANIDDEHADYFLKFKADQKIGFTLNQDTVSVERRFPNLHLQDVANLNTDTKINLLGDYNKYNVLAAIAVTKVLNIDENKTKTAVSNLKPLPGRLEFIQNNLGIKILVDYAFEPKAIEKLYQTIQAVPHNKVIHVLGSTGGGRDKSRRPILGRLAAENADIIIVTNEDPYDEDPQKIIDAVAVGAEETSNQQQTTSILKILDRRSAIKKALTLAQKNDLILITGKGAEQKMCLANGKMVDWDDRKVTKEELSKLSS